MYHPTPYCWSIDGGPTHVFYDTHLPPNTGFGWSSLCDSVQLPIEGKHFELNDDVREENITCRRCRKRVDQSYADPDNESIASVNGCLVRFKKNEEDMIVRAEKVCQNMLHHSLPFEPDSFTGNLEEQVEEVCKECWETYVDHQWTSADEGAELCVKVWEDDDRSEYFAQGAETIQNEGEAVLQLVSENGLEKDIHFEEIESITLTPARDITY